MRAYVIAIREKTLDPVKFKEYVAKGAAAFEGVEFRVHAAYGRSEALEGDIPEGVAIIEFPNFEAARSWYCSAKYQEALAYRTSCARFRLMIVDGV